MGILLVPYPARGHVAPFLRLAAELARRVPVRMIVPPRYAAAAAANGVVPIPAGSDTGARVPPGWTLGDLAVRRLSRDRRRQAALEVRAAYSSAVADEVPALTVVDPHARWLRRLAPGHRTAWLWTSSPASSAGTAPLFVNGLLPLSGVPRGIGGRLRFVGPLDGGLPEPAVDFPRHRLAGDPLLVVSFGTVFGRSRGELRWIAESFRGTGWTVVLATGTTDVRSRWSLPDNVIAAPSIPQQELLGRAAALITHGGMNSVLEAAAAGVPMLLAPRSREQRRTARRLVGWGAGAALVTDVPLPSQLERLLSDDLVADGTRRLKQLVETAPSAAGAADEVLRLADLTRTGPFRHGAWGGPDMVSGHGSREGRA